jgi:hypothetical protein
MKKNFFSEKNTNFEKSKNRIAIPIEIRAEKFLTFFGHLLTCAADFSASWPRLSTTGLSPLRPLLRSGKHGACAGLKYFIDLLGGGGRNFRVPLEAFVSKYYKIVIINYRESDRYITVRSWLFSIN